MRRASTSGFRAVDLGGNLLDLVHYLDAGPSRCSSSTQRGWDSSRASSRSSRPSRWRSHKTLAGVSTHEGDLLKVLEFAAAMGGELPPITILGIEPAELRDEPGLSGELESRFDDYVAAVLTFFAARTS